MTFRGTLKIHFNKNYCGKFSDAFCKNVGFFIFHHLVAQITITFIFIGGKSALYLFIFFFSLVASKNVPYLQIVDAWI